MDEDSKKVALIRETSIGDFCGNCGRFLDGHYKTCPECEFILKIEGENNGK